MNITIENMIKDNWYDVANIYKQGILTKNATFEKDCPDWNTWDKNHRLDCRFVAKQNEKIVGWAALSNVSGRCVYAGVSEVSIYVDTNFQGHGIGQKLMEELINESEKVNIWTLQAGIFPENKSSIRLHEKNGFRVVGIREKIGKMDNKWRDVVLLERRSKKIGNDCDEFQMPVVKK
ncbi:phosphinothricin N-acetyltransferase [Fulvivirga imtechensis AK7]|uniref:Phosphinothricin N-acetyltransferase n=1 Tax=Fulvivirga imtechensis AK7 TaxID=1237149 RepID=L8JL39_9BACT|nr:GNAT family N-acetyltransferase [Fulvivirga imtechensis]ELR68204.1 phosphinothricin N-acetyltransferase [Fulvivirga imtechensis AK7]